MQADLLLSLLKICLGASGLVLSDTTESRLESNHWELHVALQQCRLSSEKWKEINCYAESARCVEQIYSQILKLGTLQIILIKISKLVDINTCILFVLCTSVYLPERAVTQIPYAF